MTKREIITTVLNHKTPPYVPWSISFTAEAWTLIKEYFKIEDPETILQNHLLGLGSGIGFFEQISANLFKDVFGVIWDRSIDKDIGVVKEPFVLSNPAMKGYEFPDPASPRFFEDIPLLISRYPDCFRVFSIGFSLYERAWTLRGMTNLMIDFYDHPSFVRELLHLIADYNIAQIGKALQYDIDAIYFGDDWGQQRGLQMGPALWYEFIYPELKRMYSVAKDAGKYVFIHSCGDVDELFDDLVNIGVNCFNPFQPEVMDIHVLMERYKGRLAFHGGLSTQKTLPYGTPQMVREETKKLIKLGSKGGYIFAPAHSVEGDVPLANMLAFMDELFNQPGFNQKGRII